MSLSRVRVAVIPAGGRGTRLRPATRAVPKAFVPVVDRPALQHVVEEAVRAGAVEVYVVTDETAARLVTEHFHRDDPLPGMEGVEVRPVVQPVPLGLGDAVLQAASVVGDRPFFCLLADNLVMPGRDVLGSMAAEFDGRTMLCVRLVADDVLSAYGVIAPGEPAGERRLEVRDAVEKPGVAAAPSRLGIMGRYLFSPEVFSVLAATAPGHGGEIQLTDAIAALARAGRCTGFVATTPLLDVGTPYGLVHASAVLAAAHPEWGADIRGVFGSLHRGPGSPAETPPLRAVDGGL